MNGMWVGIERSRRFWKDRSVKSVFLYFSGFIGNRKPCIVNAGAKRITDSRLAVVWYIRTAYNLLPCCDRRRISTQIDHRDDALVFGVDARD